MIFRIGASLSMRSFALIARKTAGNARSRKVPPPVPDESRGLDSAVGFWGGSGVQILRLRFLCGSDILGSLCDIWVSQGGGAFLHGAKDYQRVPLADGSLLGETLGARLACG